MREYSSKISLTKNSRGIYSLDTSIGCSSGMANSAGGCYGDCYAAKSAKLYGYNFSKTVYRDFENEKHARKIVKQISKIKLPFIRIGTSGDPSENWGHTINVCKKISNCNKEIVIITKHWSILSDSQIQEIGKMNICINTSISALDKDFIRERCLSQYERLKPYCKSVLRIVSCDFNLQNDVGKKLSDIQHGLFKNDHIIDTVFRVNKRNGLVLNGVINTTQSMFLGKKCFISKFDKKTYFGKCSSCQEMCGVNLIKTTHSGKPQLYTQLSIFKTKSNAKQF